MYTIRYIIIYNTIYNNNELTNRYNSIIYIYIYKNRYNYIFNNKYNIIIYIIMCIYQAFRL